jgi:glutamate-ammonia-ligase adenylyltransferase
LDESDAAPLDPRMLLIDPLDEFLLDYHEKTRLNRTILDHLLHQAFAADATAEPEADLILDPLPDTATVQAVLGRYGFRDVQAAHQNLLRLATESVLFLSTRRCRHFLAGIAPRLLRALGETPDADLALNNLEKVTASLGAKAVLWELFSLNPPTLKLYVELCAHSPFLSDLLITNPGMIDEVLDSLILNRPRSANELRLELAELCRGAADPEPILHSFQDKELLRIGIRDLLGKDSVQTTCADLSDLAAMVFERVVLWQTTALHAKYGEPLLRDGRPCRSAWLALGKLGGREMSYHSDLDVMLIYEGDGRTSGPGEWVADACYPKETDNLHYFTQLAQSVIRATSLCGPLGRLYHVDMRLRPTGQSGTLVVPLDELVRYYGPTGEAQLWERQALTRARVVAGPAAFADAVAHAARTGALALPWNATIVDELRGMRERLEAANPGRNLKRGCGGLADIEFLVQMFQLKYGPANEQLLQANTWEALDALLTAGYLSAADHAALRAGYGFLRAVEGRLRVVTNRPLEELPDSADELAKLARRLGYEQEGGTAGARFLADYSHWCRQNRAVFRRLMQAERNCG